MTYHLSAGAGLFGYLAQHSFTLLTSCYLPAMLILMVQQNIKTHKGVLCGKVKNSYKKNEAGAKPPPRFREAEPPHLSLLGGERGGGWGEEREE